MVKNSYVSHKFFSCFQVHKHLRHNGLKGTICRNKYLLMTKLVIAKRINSFSKLLINRSQCSTGNVFVRMWHRYNLHFVGFHHFLQRMFHCLVDLIKIVLLVNQNFLCWNFSLCHFRLMRTILLHSARKKAVTFLSCGKPPTISNCRPRQIITTVNYWILHNSIALPIEEPLSAWKMFACFMSITWHAMGDCEPAKDDQYHNCW